jgi:hypothetical protein
MELEGDFQVLRQLIEDLRNISGAAQGSTTLEYLEPLAFRTMVLIRIFSQVFQIRIAVGLALA